MTTLKLVAGFFYHFKTCCRVFGLSLLSPIWFHSPSDCRDPQPESAALGRFKFFYCPWHQAKCFYLQWSPDRTRLHKIVWILYSPATLKNQVVMRSSHHHRFVSLAREVCKSAPIFIFDLWKRVPCRYWASRKIDGTNGLSLSATWAGWKITHIRFCSQGYTESLHLSSR